METLASICRTIHRKDYLTSLDLQDAFMHILVYKNCRKYLRFYWNGRCFQFRVLPFGLSLIPLEFTKILRPVLEWARTKRMRVSAYLDDLMIMGETIEACQRREIVYLLIPVYHTPGYGYQYKENDPQGSVNQDQGSSTRGKQATER
ncbi:hypothetical protein AYI69_g8855 [Smittium culicis]|uniref:Reverse transcriptase domain-containing protein n=1 Tax=Smittium culicis TaxID=133412 RepID=A0A1R1XGP4_9FUNG|nr:hypothetical protein AYI69_g8855 [Smittium culicis]